jgi:hypothetical protein
MLKSAIDFVVKVFIGAVMTFILVWMIGVVFSLLAYF